MPPAFNSDCSARPKKIYDTLLTVCLRLYKIPHMRRTAIYLTPEQIRDLAKIKKVTGVPVGEQIRRAIDAYLKTRNGK